MSFEEFLMAKDEEQLLNILKSKDWKTIDNPTNIYPVENYVTTEKNSATVEIPATSLKINQTKPC